MTSFIINIFGALVLWGFILSVMCARQKLQDVFEKKRVQRFMEQFTSLPLKLHSTPMPTIAGIQLGEPFSDVERRIGLLNIRSEKGYADCHYIRPEYLGLPIVEYVEVRAYKGGEIYEVLVWLDFSYNDQSAIFDALRSYLNSLCTETGNKHDECTFSLEVDEGTVIISLKKPSLLCIATARSISISYTYEPKEAVNDWEDGYCNGWHYSEVDWDDA